MTLSRRALFGAAGAAAGSLLLHSQAAAASSLKVPAFKAPVKDAPLLLCFNENPLGMSPAAQKAVAKAAAKGSRYPFGPVENLRKACAKFMAGKPENIMLTHGSAESIRATIEAYITPGCQLVVPGLTYSDGADTAKKNDVKVTEVPMGKNWSIDLEGMKKAVADFKGRSIVYFVNPNNPTSTIVSSKALLDWIRSKPADTMFVVDEAYAEYVTDPSFVSCKTLVDEGLDNVAVLKTFSKIFAMAGMRLGFTYAVPAVIARAKKHVAYDIMMSVPAIEAALAELADPAFLTYSREQNAEARTILTAALDKLGIAYLPSQTNFVFMNLKAPLKPFAGRMKAEAIWVGRPFPPALTWCRVSLGTPAETTYFVKKLFEFREKGWV